jgi:beta-hydroxyacyl-ACP dehydratase FabZ
MSTETTTPQTQTPPTILRTIDIKGIRKVIPHRYPFLLVDKVDITAEDKTAIGTKMVTANEEFFQGHFPDHPVMPGVLIVEALAQTACVLQLSSKGIPEGKVAYFMGINEAKFRQPVFPGSVLKLHVEMLRSGRVGKFRGEAYVDGKLCCEGEMTFAVADKQ